MTLSLLLLVIVTLGVVAGLILYFRSEPAPLGEPERDGWTDGRITPLAMGPRNRVAERVARGPVLTQAVMVAVQMARADGHVSTAEEDAIRSFIVDHVTDADSDFAKRVMEEGFHRLHSEAEVDEAVDTIRAVASEEQRRLIIQLLAHVACVDGSIDEGERRFMERVGNRMGLSPSSVEHLLTAMASMAAAR